MAILRQRRGIAVEPGRFTASGSAFNVRSIALTPCNALQIAVAIALMVSVFRWVSAGQTAQRTGPVCASSTSARRTEWTPQYQSRQRLVAVRWRIRAAAYNFQHQTLPVRRQRSDAFCWSMSQLKVGPPDQLSNGIEIAHAMTTAPQPPDRMAGRAGGQRHIINKRAQYRAPLNN